MFEGWLLYLLVFSATMVAFITVLAVSVTRYRLRMRRKARNALRERSLVDCLAEVDEELVKARAKPDARAAKVEVGMLEHYRSALLLEGGAGGGDIGLPNARVLQPELQAKTGDDAS